MEAQSQKVLFGQLLVREGLVSKKQLEKALASQVKDNFALPIGDLCVKLGFITRKALQRTLQKYQRNIYLGDLMVNMGLVSQGEVFQALELQGVDGKKVGRVLIDHGFITEENLINCLSIQLGIPKIIPSTGLVQLSILKGVSKAFLVRNDCIPLYREGDSVTVVLSDPLAEETLMALEKMFRCRIEPAVATSDDIQKCIKAIYEDLHLTECVPGEQSRDAQHEVLVIGDSVSLDRSEDNIVSVANFIISNAVTDGATDIHLEPMENVLRVRYRIDGVMRHKTDLPVSITPSLISRLKALSGLDIAQRRRHQDGRLGARVMNRNFDFRIATYPSINGESMVIRVLYNQSAMMELEMLGFSPLNLELYKKILSIPSGVVIVAGPSGMGKTTTLYSSLLYLREQERKIVTVEDPVEYTIDGIVQGQVSARTGLTYDDFVKSVLRQDPDVIMVGEIRDTASAKAVVETALTGHKVLTSFHTDETTGALLRLNEIGIETFLISSTVMSVLSQRLVRALCPHCRVPYTPGEEIVSAFRSINPLDLGRHAFFTADGCIECGNTGFQGRTVISETLLVNDQVRDAILKRMPTNHIRSVARQTSGLVSTLEDGFYKATKGITSLEEVLRLISCNDSDAMFPYSSEELVALCEMGSGACGTTTQSASIYSTDREET